MGARDETLIDHLDRQRDLAAGSALTQIDRLTSHLAELRKSVVAWQAGEKARSPRPYGNPFGDAIDAVVTFRERASMAAEVRSTLEEV